MKRSLGPLRGRRSEITISSWKTRQKTRRRRAEDAWKTCRIAIDRWKTIRIAEKKKFDLYIFFFPRGYFSVFHQSMAMLHVFHASSTHLLRVFHELMVILNVFHATLGNGDAHASSGSRCAFCISFYNVLCESQKFRKSCNSGHKLCRLINLQGLCSRMDAGKNWQRGVDPPPFFLKPPQIWL